MVGEDYGLLTGLGNAISGGLTEYKAQKDKQYNRNLQAGLLNDKGLLVNPQTGETTLSQDEQNKRDLANKTNLAGLEDFQAGNDKAIALETWNKSRLKQTQMPDMEQAYPSGKSVHDQEAFMKQYPDMLKAKAVTDARKISDDRIRAGQGLREDTIAKGAADIFDKDPTIIKYNTARNSLQRGMHTIDNPPQGKVTTQMLKEMSNDIANSLSLGAQSASNDREAQEYKNAATRWAEVKSKFTDAPEGVVSPELIDYVKQSLGRLDQGFQLNIADRGKQLGTGRAYKHTPAAQAVLDSKMQQYTAAPSAPAAPAGLLPKVGDIQDGFKFKGGDPSDQKNWEKQ